MSSLHFCFVIQAPINNGDGPMANEGVVNPQARPDDIESRVYSYISLLVLYHSCYCE